MAARGYFHSAHAFSRALVGLSVETVSSTVYSFCYGRVRLRAYRQFHFLVLSSPQTFSRSMATSVPISDRPAVIHTPRQPRQSSNYKEAVVALNSLQSNAETIRKSLEHRSESRKHNIPGMINYLQRVGVSLEDVDKLSVIHVTGTKGKGSTCAFAESILRQYSYKTGIFSSPHLIEARERIRINGRPIDRDLFSSSFWDVFDKLQATKDDSEGSMPHYFSFLTVMALYVFVREQVDVALLEVGIGGQYDSTNFVQSPVVCGISSLGLDHTNLLGNTIQDIAWHKAGIFKKGTPGITVPQPDSAMQVIINRSQEIECPLSIAMPLNLEELSATKSLQLGIAGHKQAYNAALAVQLCRVWLHAHSTAGKTTRDTTAEDTPAISDFTPTCIDDVPVQQITGLSQQMITGLCECQWPGRTQTVRRPGVTYYLDGAHTTDSMQQCVEWFQETAGKEREQIKGKVRRALVFNMTGDRAVSCLIAKLKECGFDMAAFCPNVVSTIASENIPDQLNLTVEQETVLKKSCRNRQVWDKLVSGGDAQTHHVQNTQLEEGDHNLPSQVCSSANFPCIASALQWVTHKSEPHLEVSAASAAARSDVNGNVHVQVLVTGSLHLVGGVLELIDPDMND